jgi:hypothetical protein
VQQPPVRVRPERTTLVVVLVALLGSLPLGLSSPYLAWVVLLPLVAGAWVLRARVEAGADALRVCNGLGTTTVGWDEVSGFRVPERGPVRLLRHGAKPVLLTALDRGDLPRVLAAAPEPTP